MGTHHKHPNALENLNNSPFFFQNLLAYQMSNLLLEKALVVVVKYTMNPARIFKNNWIEELPLKELLKCRLLNSHWNPIVDKLFRKDYKTHSLKFLPTPEYNFSCLYTPTKLVNFLNHFQLTHSHQLKKRSPFIYPELSVHTHTIAGGIGEDEQQFWMEYQPCYKNMDYMFNTLILTLKVLHLYHKGTHCKSGLEK